MQIMKISFVLLLMLACTYGLDLQKLDKLFENDVYCIEGHLLDELANESPSDDGLIKSDTITIVEDAGESASEMQTDALKSKGIYSENSHILTELSKEVEANKNMIMLINELATLNKIEAEFSLIDEEGPGHNKIFHVRLNLGDEKFIATGKNIKAAKRSAAQAAWQATKYERPISKVKTEKEIMKLTPTVELNNIAASMGLEVTYTNEVNQVILNEVDSSDYKYYSLDQSSKSYLQKLNDTIKKSQKIKTVKVSEPDVESQGPFHVEVKVGKLVFHGSAVTKQMARHNAAAKALEHFKKVSIKEAEECLQKGEECNKHAIKSPISLVYEVASKRKLSAVFEITDTTGPPHKPIFTTTCTVGTLVTAGEGNSKKASKKNAAEKMIAELGKVEEIGPEDRVVQTGKSKKRKKNKKINRGALNNIKLNVMDSVNSVFTMFAGDEEDSSASDESDSNKHKLLDLTNKIDLGVQFATFPNGDHYSTLVVLQSEPSFVCYGSNVDSKEAEENASLNAIAFIKQVGLDNILIPLKGDNAKPKIVIKSKTDFGSVRSL